MGRVDVSEFSLQWNYTSSFLFLRKTAELLYLSLNKTLFLFHFRFPLGPLSTMLTTLIEYETPKVVTVHNVSIGKSQTHCWKLFCRGKDLREACVCLCLKLLKIKCLKANHFSCHSLIELTSTFVITTVNLSSTFMYDEMQLLGILTMFKLVFSLLASPEAT